MTAIEFILLLNGSGVLAGGIGVARWAWGVERRLTVLETHVWGRP